MAAKDTVVTPAVSEVKVTEANNCWYSLTDATPVKVNTPPANPAR